MKYNHNGHFKIMQITDIQEIPNISVDTLNLIESAVESEKPDLVVFTGDQIKGYGISYKLQGKSLYDVVTDTISRIFYPITKRNIPFAVTFGNHDCQIGISNKEQFEKIYKKLECCIGEQAEGIDGGGTFNIPIYASDNSGRIVNNLYLFDSGTDAKGGGYEPFSKDIINWYKATRDRLKNQTGDYVPSIVFQHIPMVEYYNVLQRTSKHTFGAIRAFRTHKNEYYVLGNTCGEKDILLEPPSVPNENTGEFEAISECGDVMAVFVGHDHKNNFVGTYMGVDFGVTASSGFNCYGNRTNRGVRIIELDESKPNEYITYTRTYKDFVGNKIQRQIFDFLSFIAPETVDAAIPMILNIVFILALFIVGIVLSRIPYGKISLVNFIGYIVCTISCFTAVCKAVIYIIKKKGL